MTHVKPILMSPAMVRATWDGLKTETRRLAWGDKPDERISVWQTIEPGDLLWVRENFRVGAGYDGLSPAELPRPPARINLWYEADSDFNDVDSSILGGKLRVGRYMCRWMSRLTLEVVSAKVQRIKAITRNGASREGIRLFEGAGRTFYSPDTMSPIAEPTPYSAFAALWIGLHGHEAWNDNPEVVVIRFRAIKSNIDAILGLAPGAPQIAQDAKRSARR